MGPRSSAHPVSILTAILIIQIPVTPIDRISLAIADGYAEVISGKHSVNAAGFAIHSEIHEAHPWINAVCHAHSTAGKAYSAFGKPLPSLTQDSLKFHGKHSILYEYHGPVLSTKEGKAIARVINDRTNVVILKNHGPLSVGTTIDEACYWFICFDRCCQSQLMIDAATPARGEPATIDEEVAREAADTIGTRSRGFSSFPAVLSEHDSTDRRFFPTLEVLY
ncbi:class II aldolase/adducin N-terminal [Xylaria grammica]|nr:class II aldolase/adducin N-terminal [Xylaria grammica]